VRQVSIFWGNLIFNFAQKFSFSEVHGLKPGVGFPTKMGYAHTHRMWLKLA